MLPSTTDPAFAAGARLFPRVLRFARVLRAAGLRSDVGAVIDFSRALEVLDLGSRSQVHDAGAALFVQRPEQRAVFDAAFDRFWQAGRLVEMPSEQEAPLDGVEEPGGEEEQPHGTQVEEEGAEEGGVTVRERESLLEPGEEELEEEAPSLQAEYSAAEVIRHKEFERMTPEELREAQRLIDLIEPRLAMRRTRRYELHPHGRRLAPRTMLRRSLATGGEVLTWSWRRQVRKPRPLVVLCDISGSMEQHSRLLLRFVQALARSRARTEVFVFGTRLTRITHELRDRDADRALREIADAVSDWAGGTRIGGSFHEFNRQWRRRVLRSSAILVVMSDGWDRGDPALVGAETQALQRACHRLIWMNPLAGTTGYQPLAAGMAAAYPYLDEFLAAGTVADLERLGAMLAEATGNRERRRVGRARRVPRGLSSSGVTAPAPRLPAASRVAPAPAQQKEAPR